MRRCAVRGVHEYCADPGAGRRPGRCRAGDRTGSGERGSNPGRFKTRTRVCRNRGDSARRHREPRPGVSRDPDEIGVRVLSWARQKGFRQWEPPTSLSPFATPPIPTDSGKACSSSMRRSSSVPAPTTPSWYVRRSKETSGNLQFVTRANARAVERGARIPSRAVSLHGRMRIFACDNDTRRCAQVEVHMSPSRLRRWTTNSPPPRATAATAQHRFHQIMAAMPTPPKPSITRHQDRTKAIRNSSVSPTPIRLAPQHRKP